MPRIPLERIETGVPNLDAIVRGGLPRGSVTIVAGPPGGGKTILAQQICFHNAGPESPALYSVPQPDILVERHLQMMDARVRAFGAKRLALDSLSVFFHKVSDPRPLRDTLYRLSTVVQNSEAVALLGLSVPYGATQISRFGIEETVADGVILLGSSMRGSERRRHIEIYKLRNTAHRGGRHDMEIGPGGIKVHPRRAPARKAKPSNEKMR